MMKQNVQYIRPVITGCIGGFAGALVVGMFHLAANLYGRASWLGSLITENGTLRYLIDMAVAFVTAFLLSWILFRREERSGGKSHTESKTAVEKTQSTVEVSFGERGGFAEESQFAEKTQFYEKPRFMKKAQRTEKIRIEKQGKNTEMEMGVVFSPLQGQVIPMEEVPDDTFAAKVLGEGMAVIPSEGMVYAPFDGKVEKVYDTKHAISISSTDGIEVLIHVGINMEDSDEDFFNIFVSDGEQIERGEQLLQFDIAEMKEAGYSTVTPIIVTNSDDFDVIQLLGNGVVDQQDVLMKIPSR